MAKKAILILIIFFMQLTGFTQIRGRVIDSNNRAHLSLASISYGEKGLITTDENGLFEIIPGIYPITLEISYMGYETEEVTIEEPSLHLIIELKPAEFMLGEVIVATLNTKQKVIETAGSVALIPEKEFKVDNDVNVIPSLNRVTGIHMQSGAYNTNRLTIRGIGSRSLFSTTKVRAYFREIPLTSGDGETTIEDIDPNLIERIEIIKGPSSSLYGAGLGGTLLMQPKIPSFGANRLTYQLTAGSFGYIKNSLSFDVGNKKNRLALSLNNIHSDGFRENNEFDRFSSGISFQSFLTQKTTLNILANYIDLKAFIPSSLDRDTYENNPSAAAGNWAAAEGYEDYYKILTGIGLSHQFNTHSTLDISIFSSQKKAYERRPFNILNDKTFSKGGRLKYNYLLELNDSRLNLVTGMEFFNDKYDWSINEIIDKEEGPLISDNEELRSNLNGFLKADIKFPFKTEFSAGVNLNYTKYRYVDIFSRDSIDDSRESNFGTILSPRLSISHPVTRNLNVYIVVSHGFSPPTLPETLTPDGTINPDIQPEQGVNYEFGSKGFLINQRLFYDISIYTMRIKDLLVAQRVGEDQFIGINAGKTQHDGLELTLNYDFIQSKINNNRLLVFLTYTHANYTFTDFENVNGNYSGNELTGVPRNILNSGLAFNTDFGLYGNLNYQFVDQMPMRDDNSIYSEAYSLLNFRLGYKVTFLNHFKLDIYGLVNNLTDSKYASMISVNAPSFGGRAPRYYYPGLPRNAYAGIEFSYLF